MDENPVLPVQSIHFRQRHMGHNHSEKPVSGDIHDFYDMTYETLKFLKDCTSEIEARMKCDLLGERFDKDEYEKFTAMEPWQKTLWLYNIDCKERGIENVLN